MKTRYRALLASCLLAACWSDAPTSPTTGTRSPRFPPRLPNLPTLADLTDSLFAATLKPLSRQDVPTYDGSNESVHPAVLKFDVPWNGIKCLLASTPYPGSNATYENPSLYVSDDCEHWTPAPNVPAPLVPIPNGGYNSDPELIRIGDTVYLVYREVTTDNVIKFLSSSDGVHWSAPQEIFRVPNHQAISPTLALGPDGRLRMWYVDAGFIGCAAASSVVRMRSAGGDSIARMRFGKADSTDLFQPGEVVWHLEVDYVLKKRMYVAIYVAYHQGAACGVDDIYMATSIDGIHWRHYKLPMMNHLDSRYNLNFNTLYRTAFLYDAVEDKLEIYTSGIESSRWGIFKTTLAFGRTLRALELSNQVGGTIAASRYLRKQATNAKVMIEDR